MKRFGLFYALVGLLALPVFAEEIAAEPQAQGPLERPNARNQQEQPPNPQVQLQNQIKVIISNLYVRRFQEAVELTDDQFIKMSVYIQSFIDMRFNAAMRRDAINRRLEELSSQPNPPADIEEQLILQKRQVDQNFGNMEGQFLDKIARDLKTGQARRILQFHKKFFDEDLPELIEQARQNTPQQRPIPAPVRPNQNTRPNQQQVNPNRPGNAVLPQKN